MKHKGKKDELKSTTAPDSTMGKGRGSLVPASAEARRTTILQPVERKTHSQKDNMKRQRTMYQMREQDKATEKQLNEVEIGNPPEK